MIEPGKKAPPFTLPDQDANNVALASFSGRWVVLYFYPRDLTPGCTVEACEFSAALPRFEKLDAVVLGVSPDQVASHRRFVDKKKLKHLLLADVGAVVCGQYGVWAEKTLYGKKHLGVVRTTYLIAPDGKVAHRFDKVKAAGHAEAVRAKLAQLRSA